jgi:hypothetical protein
MAVVVTLKRIRKVNKSSIPENIQDDLAELLRRAVRGLTLREMTHEEAQHAWDEYPELVKASNKLDKKSRAAFIQEAYALGCASNMILSPHVIALTDEYVKLNQRDWSTTGENPLADLRFSMPPQNLASVPRYACPSCGKQQFLFCPHCACNVLPPNADVSLPTVTLPVCFDLVHHPQENIKKSTGTHAPVLAPSFCRLLQFPDNVPAYDPARVVILYPTDDAVFLHDPVLDVTQITKIIVIEATWQKVTFSVSIHFRFCFNFRTSIAA